MKRLVILVVLIVGSFVLSGCTMTETKAERHRRERLIANLQFRMLVEDWDYLWLMEHSTEMTQWHSWVGI